MKKFSTVKRKRKGAVVLSPVSPFVKFLHSAYPSKLLCYVYLWSFYYNYLIAGMFNGLKKIVGSKAEEMPSTPVTPDLLMTPSLTKSAKKRKVDNGFSAKKR